MNSFAKYLPSKSFLAVGSATFFSFLLVFGIYHLTHSQSPVNQPLIPIIGREDAAAALTIQNQISQIDSDADGLKDWEESFWGTNLNNKDSDGDGTGDGEEVKNNRNPNLRGPKDEVILPEENKNSTLNTETKLTATDIVARSLFSNYLEAKQNDEVLDQDLQTQIVAASLSLKDAGNTEIKRVYTEGDLQIIKNANKNVLKEYGNQMGAIMKSATWKERELEIIKRGLEKEDEIILLGLNPIIKGYESIIDASLKVSVPESATKEHLEVINTMKEIVYSLKSVQSVFKDPVRAISLFGKYPDHVNNLYRSFVDVRGLFQRNNISYAASENGVYYANFADIAELIVKQNATI